MINPASNPVWFTGIIEENNDPLGNGRVQVRIFGIHPPYDENTVTTQDLPWAILMNGTYGAIHRVPDIGEWVMGLSLDGRDHTNLRVFGTIPGMQRSGHALNSNSPNSYLKPSQDNINKLGNPPIPPQMTGEDMHYTPSLISSAFKLADNQTTPDQEGFIEPPSPHSTKPNQTTVWNASYSGSFLEINDDPNTGFINITHESGSNIQIDNTGNIKIKSLGESYNLSANSQKTYTGGRKDIIVDGGNFTMKVNNGDVIINATGDINLSSHANINISSAQKTIINAGEGIELIGAKISLNSISDNIEQKSANMIISEATNDIIVKAANRALFLDGDDNTSISGEYRVQAGNVSFNGDGSFNADFSQVHWQSGTSTPPNMPNVSIQEMNLPEPPVMKTKTPILVPKSTGSASMNDIDDIDEKDGQYDV